ncbi:MAG: preprotein translocase subunit SecG [Lachnospiraceae bacterium]|nr:preprotein translocase subunit SecG [Lachnospiraceae bacterium]MBR6638039.1 preprotein translocase subunit SecG [Lachnospiraceae bacterium]
MDVLKIVLTIIYALVCLGLIVIVLLQEGKQAGLSGSISGAAAETYWGKNKSRSAEGKLDKLTKILGVAFIALSLIINLI